MTALAEMGPACLRSIWLTGTSQSFEYREIKAQRTGKDRQCQVLIPDLEAATPSVGRNQPCPCGSGRKFKKCCGP